MTKFARAISPSSVAAAVCVSVLASGVIGWRAFDGPQSSTEPPSPQPLIEKTTPDDDFVTNENGQTIGTYYEGAVRPDLIHGRTDSGTPGFFYLDDVVPVEEDPARGSTVTVGPEDIAHADENGDIKIKVYAFDGSTVLGEFTLAHTSERTAAEELADRESG